MSARWKHAPGRADRWGCRSGWMPSPALRPFGSSRPRMLLPSRSPPAPVSRSTPRRRAGAHRITGPAPWPSHRAESPPSMRPRPAIPGRCPPAASPAYPSRGLLRGRAVPSSPWSWTPDRWTHPRFCGQHFPAVRVHQNRFRADESFQTDPPGPEQQQRQQNQQKNQPPPPRAALLRRTSPFHRTHILSLYKTMQKGILLQKRPRKGNLSGGRCGHSE